MISATNMFGSVQKRLRLSESMRHALRLPRSLSQTKTPIANFRVESASEQSSQMNDLLCPNKKIRRRGELPILASKAFTLDRVPSRQPDWAIRIFNVTQGIRYPRGFNPPVRLQRQPDWSHDKAPHKINLRIPYVIPIGEAVNEINKKSILTIPANLIQLPGDFYEH